VGQPGTSGSTDAAGSAARFYGPYGLAFDPEDNLCVADLANHTIRKVTAQGMVTTLAGRAGYGGSEDGTGSEARFSYPEGVAVDREGNLLVADGWNGTIRKVTPAGVVTTLAGLARNDDGSGSAARSRGPVAVALDSAGILFVAEERNTALRKVTPTGEVTTLWLSWEDGDDSSAGLYRYPCGMAVDSAGSLYVTDEEHHAIRKVSPKGVVTTIGGFRGVIGSADGIGSSAGFFYPSGIVVDGKGTVYVAEAGNNRITRGVPISPPTIAIQPAGETNNVGTTATFSVTATGSAPLSYQWSLNRAALAGATDSSFTLTNVQFGDAGNYSVQVTNVAGSTVSSNAPLVVNLPPTVSISAPTNGSVLLAPASVTLLADATDDLAVVQVEFWSGSNSLGTVTNAPWYVLQTNLPAGGYDYTAVAVDALGLASTSTVCTVTVLSQPPTTALTLVTNSLMVRQTGLFYQTVRVGNPTAAPFAALRLWVELDANSIARRAQVWNATGRSNGVPYLSYSLSLAPDQSVDLQIEYYVPDRRTRPSPAFRTEVVAPEPPLEPEGSVLSSVRQLPLTNGLFLVEFSTGPSQLYYVQYSSDLTGWKTALPAVMGTGSRVQWIDNGPPKTESAPSSEPNRFYRVIRVP